MHADGQANKYRVHHQRERAPEEVVKAPRARQIAVRAVPQVPLARERGRVTPCAQLQGQRLNPHRQPAGRRHQQRPLGRRTRVSVLSRVDQPYTETRARIYNKIENPP